MTQREEFEAWYVKTYPFASTMQGKFDREGGDYTDTTVNVAWQAFQYAQAAQPAHALNWSELVAWWESGAEQWEGLRDIVSRMVAHAHAIDTSPGHVEKQAGNVQVPDLPVNWAWLIHYPDCWDTAAYPTLRDAIHECLAWSGCSVCKPAQLAQPGWLPIESAPKDGTVVLLFGEWAGEIHGPNKTASIDVGFWQGGEGDYPGNDWWATTTGDAYACWVRATHWMPLPAAPSTKEGE